MDFLTGVHQTVYPEAFRPEVRAFYQALPNRTLRVREGFAQYVLDRVVWNESVYTMQPLKRGQLTTWMDIRDIASRCDGLWSPEDVAVSVYMILRGENNPQPDSGGHFLSLGRITSLYYDQWLGWTVWTYPVVSDTPAFCPPHTKFFW